MSDEDAKKNNWLASAIAFFALAIGIMVALSIRLGQIQDRPPLPPTETRVPTATLNLPTIAPTSAATPTNTAVPPATDTPSPTVTPSPSNTPVQTPIPTATKDIDTATCAGVRGDRLYTIQPGDTLWGIADSCLGDPLRWVEICELNGLSDCNYIHAGNSLVLPEAAR